MKKSKFRLRVPEALRPLLGNSFRGRVMFSLAFVLVGGILLTRLHAPSIEYRLNEPWQGANLVAPFDFAIEKPQAEFAAEVEHVRRLVPPVYVLDENQGPRAHQGLQRYFSLLLTAFKDAGLQDNHPWPAAENTLLAGTRDLVPKPAPLALQALWQHPAMLPELEKALLATAADAYAKGFIDDEITPNTGPFVSLRPVATAERRLETQLVLDRAGAIGALGHRTNQMPPLVQQFARELFTYFVQPNYKFNEALHTAEQEAASLMVSPTRGKVSAGQVIVAQGQVVSKDIAQRLDSLNKERNATHDGFSALTRLLGQLILMVLLCVAVLVFLQMNRAEIYTRNSQLVLLFTIYLLILGLVVLINNLTSALAITDDLDLYLAIPVTVAPILVTIFFDDRVGYLSNILVTVMGSLVAPDRFEFFLIHSISGSFAVFQLKFLRRRSQFFTMSGYLLLTYCATYFGYQLFLKGDFEEVNYGNFLLLVINMFFTLGTYPLVYIFEQIFGITSNLTYMELLDTDHPLLKELAITAPGTYQHSLQVANIAEEAAKRIGANPLLAHVGALFHDIGKLHHPEHFTENQQGPHSPHLDLSPLQSAQMIIGHVQRGVELGREHRLPEEVIDFIRTHHGNTRVEYFYRRYVAANPSLHAEADQEFRYKGPLPISKEQCILMISDSVEAASRSLQDPTKEQFEALVDRIIDGKVQDRQFIHARITFRDLNKIRREVLRQLLSIYHNRIVYPEPVRAGTAYPNR